MTDEPAVTQAKPATIFSLRHLFVCTNELASGKPACGKNGGREIVAAVQQELLVRARLSSGVGLAARVTPCSCLGPCFDGPNAIVYPDGVWYGGLIAADAQRIVDHLIDGAVLADRRIDPPGE